MRTARPTLRESLFGWFAAAATPVPPAEAGRVQHIRERMLAELEGCAKGGVPTGLYRGIYAARDAQSLWYWRSELMQALCVTHGESVARRIVAGLTPLFQGAIPDALLVASMRRTF